MIKKWHDDGWRKRFALLPMILYEGETKVFVWLEWTWQRFNGLYTEVRLKDPRKEATQ